jgi:diguanylate cyclase (GGDEF)-like protein
MSGTELQRAQSAALRTLDRFADAREAFGESGEDPAAFVRMVAGIVVECDSRALDEIPFEQALRAGVAVERLRSRGLPLEHLLELSMAAAAAVDRLLDSERAGHLGRALVLALTRAYLDAEIGERREQEKELRALIGITRAVNRTLDPAQVAEAGLNETIRAMGLDAGGIWLRQAERLTLVHTHGVPQAVRRHLQKIDPAATEPVRQALRRGTPVQFEVSRNDPVRAAYRSSLVVPLLGARGPLGVLAVGSRRARSFDEAEVGFVRAVGDHLASALDHAFEHRREAHTDYLTGLANRSEFESAMRRELAAVNRHRRPLSLLLLDLDQLKRINDRYGHHSGDEAIRVVADVIRKAVRTSDVCARLGGDEFGVAMPEAGLGQAREVVARINDALREVNLGSRIGFDLELSCGVAEWQSGQDYGDLFMVADRNLYQDKRRRQRRRTRQAAGRLGPSKASSGSNSSPATR